MLHICCGICAAGAAERLLAEGHDVRGYFFNPNIYPEEEYGKRLESAREAASMLGFPLDEGLYTPAEWLSLAAPLGDEPEGGRRCEVCFRYRLEDTFLHMKETGCDAFASTLTIGPRKPASVVNRVGTEIGGDAFLARDFKKKAGVDRANELAAEWNLHRQHYCGCIYSLRERESSTGG